MNQKTITDALLKALANGSGSLDDLDNLLKRAREDVEKAKEAEKNAAATRAKNIADLANRLLNNEITDEDAAFVLNAWLAKKGHKGSPFTAKDLNEIFDSAEEAATTLNHDLNKALQDLTNDINEWCKNLGAQYDKNKKPVEKKPEDPDDVINNFLEKFGLK